MLLQVGGKRSALGLLAIRRVWSMTRSAHTASQTLEYKPIKKVMVANRGASVLDYEQIAFCMLCLIYYVYTKLNIKYYVIQLLKH